MKYNIHNYIKTIILFILILLYLYFAYRKNYLQFFTIQVSKPEIKIDKQDTLLWLHSEIDKISIDNTNFTTTFQASQKIFKTNKNIKNDVSYYNGFYFQIEADIKNISIGLHHLNNTDTIGNSDFSFLFLGNNTLSILENNKIQNINYCINLNKEHCLGNRNIYKYEENDSFGIVIHQHQVHYVIIREGKNMGIIIHQSQNKISYPISPFIYNPKNNNTLSKFYWLNSGIVEPPTEWSLEVLNKLKYADIGLPPEIALSHTTSPTTSDDLVTSITPAPTDFSWKKKVSIIDASINKTVLTILLKVSNIDQAYIDSLYDINILLSNNKTEKVLSIPYFKTDSLKLIDSVKFNLVLNTDIGTQIDYFYQKDIIITVKFRLSQFSGEENLLSNTFTLQF